MNAIVLPTRRDEDWRYSDLAAALRDHPLPEDRGPGPVIARLAGGVRRIDTPAGGVYRESERLDGQGLDARATEITIGEGGFAERFVVQTGAGVALSLAQVRLARGARFRQTAIVLGATLARIETQVEACGEDAVIELNAVYLVGRGRHADITSRVVHSAVGGRTTQLVKGCARKGGRGVFQGRIEVARAAQKTDARQNHHGLLLEEGAEIDAKPELMIYADDVACAHGATTGGLDEGAIFYMRQRGLAEAEARALLVEGFLREAIPDDLDAEHLAEAWALIHDWLRTP